MCLFKCSVSPDICTHTNQTTTNKPLGVHGSPAQHPQHLGGKEELPGSQGQEQCARCSQPFISHSLDHTWAAWTQLPCLRNSLDSAPPPPTALPKCSLLRPATPTLTTQTAESPLSELQGDQCPNSRLRSCAVTSCSSLLLPFCHSANICGAPGAGQAPQQASGM